MPSADDITRSLSDDPVAKGREFELLCKWLLENDPQYVSQLQHVWLWRDWPECPGPDLGIDLVAQTRHGELWAIQAKAYAAEQSIRKQDIDTFLSASSTATFCARLLIATTDRLGVNARQTISQQEKPVHVVLLSDLKEAQVIWPESVHKLDTGGPVQSKHPLPHQRAALDDLKSGLKTNRRGQLIMPCGTGKTLVSLWLTAELGATRTLVMLPSLSLMRQTISEWSANTTRPFDLLAVCSDDSVAGTDETVHHTYELPWPVTTAPENVSRFLESPRDEPRVVFCTYQSSTVIREAQEQGAPSFDLAIADEAHRCAGKTGGAFSTILSEDAIRCDRRVFATATPRYIPAHISKRAAELGHEVVSMDDESLFGGVLHRLSFAQAVERRLLCDYQLLVIGVDDHLRGMIGQRTLVVTPDGAETDTRMVGAQVAIARAMRDLGIRRVISFHSRVSRAKSFAEQFTSALQWFPGDCKPAGTVWSKHVSGEMSAGHRRRILDQLANCGEGVHGLVANARCLVEGVDVPALDAIAFVDPKASQIDIVQAVGRVMRTSPATGKTIGTIVIPVVMGQADDPEEVLGDSSFSTVWSVVRALRAHDEEFGTELDRIRFEFGKTGVLGDVSERLVLSLGTRVEPEFVRSLWLRVVETATPEWEYGYGKLAAFANREGHTSVPAGHMEGDCALESWVRRQRGSHRSRSLSAERISKLEAIDTWSWDPHADQWEEAFAALCRFAEREGHADVRYNHREEGFKLGQWVVIQRSTYGLGNLSQERAARLEHVSGWSWAPYADRWEASFATLKAYVEREGHSRVPNAHLEGSIRLGSWVATQRQHRRRGELEPERASRLEGLPGWSWNAADEKWEERFALLLQFVEREGHAAVPYDHQEQGAPLGAWAYRQRKCNLGGTLDAERALRLGALPGWSWDPSAQRWDRPIALLERFVEREGHSVMPHRHIEDGFKLGAWARARRAEQKRGSLDPVLVERLDAMPGWTWDATEARWEKAFAVLKQFVKREGHALVNSRQWEAGYGLGDWVVRQRMAHANGELRAERASRLEALPGWSWDPKPDKWEEWFALLESFVAREGHACVPHDHQERGENLGRWVSKQRSIRNRGTMSSGRCARLEALPGWVWESSRWGNETI